ncbi:MAG: hypothetical protein WB791_06810 [Waddliaceae bacterium]
MQQSLEQFLSALLTERPCHWEEDDWDESINGVETSPLLGSTTGLDRVVFAVILFSPSLLTN